MKKVIVALMVLTLVGIGSIGIPTVFAGDNEALKQQKELLRELQEQNQLLRQQLEQQKKQQQVSRPVYYNPYLVPSGAMVRGDLPAYAGGRCGYWYGSGEYYPSIFTSEKVRVIEYPDGSRVVERSPDIPTKILRAGTVVGLGALLR